MLANLVFVLVCRLFIAVRGLLLLQGMGSRAWAQWFPCEGLTALRHVGILVPQPGVKPTSTALEVPTYSVFIFRLALHVVKQNLPSSPVGRTQTSAPFSS